MPHVFTDEDRERAKVARMEAFKLRPIKRTTTNISISIPRDWVPKLNRLAEERQTTRSKLICGWVGHFLDAIEKSAESLRNAQTS